MLDNFINILSWITYIIYVFAIGSGLFIILSILFNLDKLKEKNSQMMQPETSPTNLAVRLLFGLSLITINSISMMLVVSLGADGGYVKDPYGELGYMNSATPSDAELKLALFVLTLSRSIGAWALTFGLKHGQYSGHPQEQVRQSARLRAFWGAFCGVIFIYPEFWMAIAENYYSELSYFNNLFRNL